MLRAMHAGVMDAMAVEIVVAATTGIADVETASSVVRASRAVTSSSP
jgi:hypothetical protein